MKKVEAEKIAAWMIEDAVTHTNNCSWNISPLDISIQFPELTLEEVYAMTDEIEEALDQDDRLLEPVELREENGVLTEYALNICGKAVCDECSSRGTEHCEFCEVPHDDQEESSTERENSERNFEGA